MIKSLKPKMTRKKKAAVICAAGLGDALNMFITSYQLIKKGWDVITFTPHLSGFSSWLAPYQFSSLPPLEQYENTFSSYDLVVLQNDNTDRAKKIIELAKEKKIKKLSIFYCNYRFSKHGPLREGLDFALDETSPIADTTAEATAKLLNLKSPSKELGMIIPKESIFKKYPNRVAIHPTSTNPAKNWPASKFIRLAHSLKKRGFFPAFIVSEKEYPSWRFVEDEGFFLPSLKGLDDLSHFLYESGYFLGNDSGPGHLASYLQIPTLVIAHRKIIRQWRPGWLLGEIVMPPRWVPNLKGLRLREERWKNFLSVSRVLSTFSKIILKS